MTSRSITASQWTLPGWAYAGAAVTAVVGAGLVATEDGPVLCPFRLSTGGYCPGCGATRAVGRLLRGDVAGSWHHHPIVLLAGAELLVLGLAAVWLGSGRRRQLLDRDLNRLLVANLVLLLAIWAVRLATGWIPAPFS